MQYFEKFYSKIENRKFNTWCKYTSRIDTYGCGCQHDCSYCYAKSLLDFRKLWNSKKPKKANIVQIKNCLKTIPKNEVIKLGGMTDCFQPIELTEQVTFKTIKLLNQFRLNYLIVTKSSICTRPEYLAIYDKNLAHFQITITNTDDKKCAKYEKTSKISERIKSIELLQLLGFDVSIRLSPLIESFIDFDVLNSIKCDKILIEFLKVNHWVKKWFDIDYSKYSLKYGGYEHLQLDEKIKIVNKITGFNQMSVGEYVFDHYKYFSENVNFNREDCCNLTFRKIYTNPIQLQLF